MSRRRTPYTLADLLLIITLIGLILGFLRWLGRSPQGGHHWLWFSLFELAFVAWFFAWRALRARRTALTCEECGGVFVPRRGEAAPSVCPQCRTRSLDPTQVRWEQSRGLRAIPVILALFAVGLGYLLSGPVAARSGPHYWVALPLVALGASLGIFAVAVLAALAFVQVRNRLLRSEGLVIAKARRCSGRSGQIIRSGPLTFWSSGPTDPVPMLVEQREVARRRFEALFGEPVEARQPLRILCFDRRGAFVAFYHNMIPNLWNLDGLYLNRPIGTITYTTEAVPYRLQEPERTARCLFGFALLDEAKGFTPPPWLQQGIGNAVAGDDGGDLARLNRKMVVALARGTAFDADLFHPSPGRVVKLARGWYDHRTFARLNQFNAQSWSVVEYLGGAGATDERRARFRAFLKDLGKKDSRGAVLERHFGHGLGPLLEGWRGWVGEQGIGAYAPPPPRLREELLGRLIPTMMDRSAKVMERILAIRDMGRVGHLLGADALIDLLRAGDEVLKEEVVWSLEAISGQVRGDDVEQWSSWWAGLSEHCFEESESPSPGVEGQDHQ